MLSHSQCMCACVCFKTYCVIMSSRMFQSCLDTLWLSTLTPSAFTLQISLNSPVQENSVLHDKLLLISITEWKILNKKHTILFIYSFWTVIYSKADTMMSLFCGFNINIKNVLIIISIFESLRETFSLVMVCSQHFHMFVWFMSHIIICSKRQMISDHYNWFAIH